jgi:hypothetical protein
MLGFATANLRGPTQKGFAQSMFSVLKLSPRPRSSVLVLALVAGCSSTPDDSGLGGSGGSDTAGGSGGGSNATGGVGTGGVGAGGSGRSGGASGSGGASATGGAPNVGGAGPVGGATGTGGARASGGATNAGGGPSGGASASGGVTNSGGGTNTGGAGETGGCAGQGEIKFVPSFDDSVDESYRAGLASCVELAGDIWSEHFVVPFDVTLEVLIVQNPAIATANCRSTGSAAWDRPNNIYELSAAYEIRTGMDPNGASVDIEMNFGTSLTNGTYWFDPDPTARTADIPSNKIDVLSTCTHELGHAIGFSGARSDSTGGLPGYSFLYDEFSVASGEDYYFSGPEAEAAYGGMVPQNREVLSHLGNVPPGPGYDLDLDLMHGTPTRYRYRYLPSDVDLGILADMGLPVKGTSAADAVCGASETRAKVLGSVVLGPTPPFVE